MDICFQKKCITPELGIQMLATKKQIRIMYNLNEVSNIEMDYIALQEQEEKKKLGSVKNQEKSKEKIKQAKVDEK